MNYSRIFNDKLNPQKFYDYTGLHVKEKLNSSDPHFETAQVLVDEYTDLTNPSVYRNSNSNDFTISMVSDAVGVIMVLQLLGYKGHFADDFTVSLADLASLVAHEEKK